MQGFFGNLPVDESGTTRSYAEDELQKLVDAHIQNLKSCNYPGVENPETEAIIRKAAGSPTGKFILTYTELARTTSISDPGIKLPNPLEDYTDSSAHDQALRLKRFRDMVESTVPKIFKERHKGITEIASSELGDKVLQQLEYIRHYGTHSADINPGRLDVLHEVVAAAGRGRDLGSKSVRPTAEMRGASNDTDQHQR